MAVAAGTKPVSLDSEETKSRSLLADTWLIFKRNRASVMALLIIIAFVFTAITANLWKNAGLLDDPIAQHRGSSYAQPFECAVDNAPGKPQFCFIAGADNLGRDIFSRMIFGTQISLIVGVVGT